MTNIDFSELSEIELAAVSGGVEKFSDVNSTASKVNSAENTAITAVAMALYPVFAFGVAVGVVATNK